MLVQHASGEEGGERKASTCVIPDRDVHYALRVITGNVDGPCVMWIFRGNVPYVYGASLVLLGLEGSSLKQLG